MEKKKLVANVNFWTFELHIGESLLNETAHFRVTVFSRQLVLKGIRSAVALLYSSNYYTRHFHFHVTLLPGMLTSIKSFFRVFFFYCNNQTNIMSGLHNTRYNGDNLCPAFTCVIQQREFISGSDLKIGF